MSRYRRTFRGATLDVYRVLDLFGVTAAPRQHAIKKLLMAGERGAKDREQDLREAIQAIERELEMMREDAEPSPQQEIARLTAAINGNLEARNDHHPTRPVHATRTDRLRWHGLAARRGTGQR